MVTDPPQTGRVVRFGTFELDRAAGELRKSGRKVRLQEQPLQLLAALVEKPGEVVTREELKDRLWPGDTYVDFDRSLNTAASKLRDALGDSASSPRFVETLPRRGYRFLASVETDANGTGGLHRGEAQAWVDQSSGERSGNPPLAWRRIALIEGLALVGLAIAVALLWPPSEPVSTGQLTKFDLPTEQRVAWPVVSPDGQKVAYLRGTPLDHSIWIQDLGDWEPRKIDGTEGSDTPFWSPDSTWIGFGQDEELKKVSVDGGSLTVLCRLPGFYQSGAWRPDGSAIVFSAGEGGRLYEISARGGEPQPLLRDQKGTVMGSPHFLPTSEEGRFLLVSSGNRTLTSIYLVDLETEESREITRGAFPVYSDSGHILYQTANSVSGISALPFSLDSLEAIGDPFPVAPDGWEPSVSRSRALVYRRAEEDQAKLTWLDRNGEPLAESGVAQERIGYLAISPDESRVAMSAAADTESSIWIQDFHRTVKTRVTSQPGPDLYPLWSPSGEEIVFSRNSDPNSGFDIYLARTAGNGEAEPLIATEWKEFATGWSSDGNYILYDRSGADTRNDIWRLERNGDAYEPRPFLESRYDQRAAQISPDGKHFAFVSNKSGDYEVYVRDFPEGRQEWKASEGGGWGPHWSKDGRELYYVDTRATLHALPVSRDPEFSLGTPKALFQAAGLRGSYVPRYDVSSDGRFLVREWSDDNPESIRVVMNWFEDFGEPPGAER